MRGERAALIISVFIFLSLGLIELLVHPLQFWVDEMFHVFAAQGLLATGEPILPSGLLYDRSIPTTLLVAGSFNLLGVSEFAARLPFLAVGLLSILASYALVRLIYGPKVALVTTFLLSISSWQIYWSTDARMYVLLELVYLVFLILLYRFSEELRGPISMDRAARAVVWLAGSAAALVISYYIHQFFYLVAASGLGYIAHILLRQIADRSGLSRRGTAALVIASALAAVVVLIYLKAYVSPESTPIGMRLGELYYSVLLLRHFPFYALFVAASVGTVILGRESRNPLVMLGFFIPFFLLTFFLDQKNSRYLFFTFPLFVAMAAHGLCYLWEKADRSRGLRGRAVLLLMAGLMLLQTLAGTYGLISSDYQPIPYEDPHPHWAYASEYVEDHLEEGDVVLSTMPVCTLYYLGKTDYWLRQNEYYGYLDGDGVLRDRYTGAIILDDYEAFIEAVKGRHGWIIADRKLTSYFTDPHVLEYVLNETDYMAEGSDKTISVYRL